MKTKAESARRVPSAVFLISMSENTEYYLPRDCESLLQETADGISPA